MEPRKKYCGKCLKIFEENVFECSKISLCNDHCVLSHNTIQLRKLIPALRQRWYRQILQLQSAYSSPTPQLIYPCNPVKWSKNKFEVIPERSLAYFLSQNSTHFSINNGIDVGWKTALNRCFTKFPVRILFAARFRNCINWIQTRQLQVHELCTILRFRIETTWCPIVSPICSTAFELYKKINYKF